MRIAQFVSLISQYGAFGGPVSVARGQCEELARRGHEVTLYAGWDGRAECAVPGVDVRLHRVHRVVPTPGFSGLLAPTLLRQFARHAPSVDVAHVHLARDLLTLSVTRLAAARTPRLVVQTHGMVMPDNRPIARLTDLLATRLGLARADTIAVLTEAERAGVERVARQRVATELLPNGIAVSEDQPAREPHGDGAPTVLFCARLHPRKRVLAFAEMARILLNRGVEASFVVAGPDEGDLVPLRAYVARHDIAARFDYVGGLSPQQVRAALAAAAVFVLPSEREPFPMTLLEAMSESTPAVITTGCMIADRFDGSDGPVVTDGTPAQLADAVGRLLADPDEAARLGRRSRDLVERQFSIGAVVDRLESIYRREPDIG
ncbi:glycosyltransferase [uncultured Jatrophihabitans sp.]|uniref:glycosyltransferase n=1 Tax=uncultured Jatrophihabitans sp. TaxID=1610747 RepID=UPI0035CAA559